MSSKTKEYSISQSGGEVFKITITEPEGVTYEDIIWDSKTGLVTAIVDGERKIIPYTGTAIGTLAPKGFTATNIYTVSHHYWYY